MNFYVDFEATQPEQEIISIGVYCDNKESFYALVKPQFSKVSKYITDMTGITNEMLADRDDFDAVLNDLYIWCTSQESNLNNWHFYFHLSLYMKLIIIPLVKIVRTFYKSYDLVFPFRQALHIE